MLQTQKIICQQVNIQDLPVLIAGWGNCESCHADQTGNGVVEIADLRIIIAKWS